MDPENPDAWTVLQIALRATVEPMDGPTSAISARASPRARLSHLRAPGCVPGARTMYGAGAGAGAGV